MDEHALAKLEARLTAKTPILGGWRWRRAAAALAGEGSPRAVWALANAFPRGDAEERRLLVEALRDLAGRHNEDAGEALCFLATRHDDPLAREAALTGNLAPREPDQRALFYFLSEQWDNYERLDFDHSLLQAAYEAGDADLRRRIAAQAWHAGRVEWVGVAAGGRQGRRLGEMNDREWWAAIATLSKRVQAEEMWQLAQSAPALWSARLLSRVQGMRWLPGETADRQGIAALFHLAEQCEGEPPASPGVLLRCRKRLEGHKGLLTALALSSDQRVLATGSFDNTVRLWRFPEGEPLQTLEGHAGAATCLATGAGGWILASGGLDGAVRLWSFPSGKPLKRLEGHAGGVLSLAMRADGRILVSGGGDGTIRFWGLPGGWGLKKLAGDPGSILSLAISPDGSLLASGDDHKSVRLWRFPEGEALGLLPGHGGDVRCLAISPDSRLLASGSEDKSIRLWEIPAGRALATLEGHRRGVTALAISPDGQVLASGGWDDTIRLWSLPAGRALHTLEGDGGGITALAFSADGKVLVTGSQDRTARLWCSDLTRLLHLPVAQTTLEDMRWVEETLAAGNLFPAERRWLAFLRALMQWRHRYDIELAAPRRIAAGEFDIELEVAG